MLLPWILCGISVLAVILLAIRIRVMQKSMTEICKDVEEQLSADTNQLITVSSGDRHVRRLARELNRHLSELRRLRRQYQTGDRELKEAVTNISHDLRTPLTAICGYLDLLEREETSEDVARYIGQIRNRSETMKSLTEELFRYSVITSSPTLSLEDINICRVLEESLISFYGAFRQKGITPEICLPDTEVRRELDPLALSRIFENIIGNAIKYSDGDLSVTLSEQGRITFSNTASGLSAVEVGKLFDRFYTVDSARSSTGLGLSIAKILVESMKGAITADYKNGKLYIIICFASGETSTAI